MLRSVAVLVLLAGLAVPAAAAAQSAGDEQYRDPFAGGEPNEQQEQPATSGDPEPAPTPAPATGSAETVVEVSQEDGGPVLPVTGGPLVPLAAVGAGLLVTGALLRRRT